MTIAASSSSVFTAPPKSVLAAIDCERLAAARGLEVTADFAGTEPDADIAPAVAAALRAEGLDLRGKKPRLVTRGDVAAADQVVAFGCDLGVASVPGAPDRTVG